MALSRIEPIIQSLQDWVRDYLDGLGYSSSYELRDTYPHERTSPLEKTIVVLTKTISFPIRYHEVGGPLVSEEHNFAFDVLGATEKMGVNIARHVEERCKTGSYLPLKDYATAGQPVVNKLEVEDVFGNRMNFTDPRPWQQHWYTVTVAIVDEYNVSFAP